MIDQARYRHNQHRNRFKDAIDYLDNIFEDFQKEYDSQKQKKQTSGVQQDKSRRPQVWNIGSNCGIIQDLFYLHFFTIGETREIWAENRSSSSFVYNSTEKR